MQEYGGALAKRVNYMLKESKAGIKEAMAQYGYCQIDGFLGGKDSGYADTLRDEMKRLFDRGWFSSTEEQTFKVGQYRITNQDTDHRYTAQIQTTGKDGEKRDNAVEAQYEVAPSLINFIRSFLISASEVMSDCFEGELSQTLGYAELWAFTGQGARVDRRVDNEWGFNTLRGFVPDPRKVTVFYFVNPDWSEEHGGHLQLEGVVTPTGATSVAPVHDRLVIFWADKTVWSFRPHHATAIREYEYMVVMRMMAEDPFEAVDYDPKRFAAWFPELRNQPIEYPIPPDALKP